MKPHVGFSRFGSENRFIIRKCATHSQLNINDNLRFFAMSLLPNRTHEIC